MEDVSLHILDLVQNSIKANADIIEINIYEDISNNLLYISIKDNGDGMNRDTVEKVLDPFYTTRTTRRVGLGLPLLKHSAEATGGSLSIISEAFNGTEVKAIFISSHIDCLPLGSMEDTITALILCNQNVDFIYTHRYGNKTFRLNTAEIRDIMDGVPLEHPDVISWIQDYIKDGLNEISGGV